MAAIFDYYVDKNLAIIAETDLPTATVGLASTYTGLLSSIPTPDGGTLDQCQNITITAEYYYSANGALWHIAGGWIWSANIGQGLIAKQRDYNSFYIQTGNYYYSSGVNSGGSKSASAGYNDATRVIRLHIGAVKL